MLNAFCGHQYVTQCKTAQMDLMNQRKPAKPLELVGIQTAFDVTMANVLTMTLCVTTQTIVEMGVMRLIVTILLVTLELVLK